MIIINIFNLFHLIHLYIFIQIIRIFSLYQENLADFGQNQRKTFLLSEFKNHYTHNLQIEMLKTTLKAVCLLVMASPRAILALFWQKTKAKSIFFAFFKLYNFFPFTKKISRYWPKSTQDFSIIRAQKSLYNINCHP